jgi:hypothetical protein
MNLEKELERNTRRVARDMQVIAIVSFLLGAGLATLLGAHA